MTDKDRELAEDVIRDFIQDEYLPRHRMILDVDEIIELMQAYHSAKMAEVKIALKDGIKTRTYQTRFNIPCDFPQEKVEQMIDEIIDEMFIRASESNDR